MKKRQRAKEHRRIDAIKENARKLSYPVPEFQVHQPLLEWIAQEKAIYDRRIPS